MRIGTNRPFNPLGNYDLLVNVSKEIETICKSDLSEI